MVHTLKILSILIKKQKYKTTMYKQQHNQKLYMEWAGGKLEIQIQHSRKA